MMQKCIQMPYSKDLSHATVISVKNSSAIADVSIERQIQYSNVELVVHELKGILLTQLIRKKETARILHVHLKFHLLFSNVRALTNQSCFIRVKAL